MTAGGGYGPAGLGSGQAQPLQRDLEATAWTEVNKMAAQLIRPDTLEVIPFSQMNPQMTWKYSTDASKPTLDRHLNTLRMDTGPTTTPEEKWTVFYDDLINQLPKNIKEQLLKELTVPLKSRNLAYVVLNRTMVFISMYMAWLERVSSPEGAESRQAAFSEINAAIPMIALAAGTRQMEEVSEAARENLEIGRNEARHYDEMKEVLRDYEKLQQRIKAIVIQVADGRDPSTVKGSLKRLANDIHSLAGIVTSKSLEGQLNILIPSLEGMAFVTAACALPHASPSLLLSSCYALSGLNCSESEGGIIGHHLEQVINGICDGVCSLAGFDNRAELKELDSMIYDLNEYAGGSE